ncbi:MAG: hypothetical protein ACJAYU_005452 [Bradymonadia bacterium]
MGDDARRQKEGLDLGYGASRALPKVTVDERTATAGRADHEMSTLQVGVQVDPIAENSRVVGPNEAREPVVVDPGSFYAAAEVQ